MNDKIKITNEDNMQLMARYEDNYFDLAIVDPPYEIERFKKKDKNPLIKLHKKMRDWDYAPDKKYFDELFRVSKNQIIWGANFMNINLGNFTPIIWDKKNGDSMMADGELAYYSRIEKLKIFRHAYIGRYNPDPVRIHPTQKPIALYEWLLKNYANDGFKILDTHLGSGSIAIAIDSMNKIEKMNLTLVACELDKEYFEGAKSRIKEKTNWQSLF